MSKSKRYLWQLVIAALCVALGVVLPIAVHSVPNAGSVLLPMHLPVLLCGLLCGPFYGLCCGLLTPLLSCLLTGMPSWGYLPSMLCELAVYGLLAGVFIFLIRTPREILNIYVALLAAMLGGRVVYGIVNALIFRAGSYSLQLWLTGAFVTALPGIVIQLVVLPPIVMALRKAKLAFKPEG